MTYEPTREEIKAALKAHFGLDCADQPLVDYWPDETEYDAAVERMRAALIAAASARPAYQQRVDDWLIACFGEEIARDKTERNHRFLEEALEAVQSETMWQELVEKDDRTSPAEYPDMALITRDELAAMLRALAGERDAADERLAARIADYEEHRARLIAERDAAIAQRDAAQRQCEQWAATASEWALEKERLQDDAKHYDETRSIAVGTLRARLEQVTAERDAVSASLTRVEDERARLWTEKRDILGKLWIKQAAVETMKAKRDAALAQLAQAREALVRSRGVILAARLPTGEAASCVADIDAALASYREGGK